MGKMFATRLSDGISWYARLFQKRFHYLQKNATTMLGLLLLGFLVGNLFGTVLNTIRAYVLWDVLIGWFLIVFMELLSYATYHENKRFFMIFLIDPKIVYRPLWRSINFFKVGLMTGFFIDAFKVGS